MVSALLKPGYRREGKVSAIAEARTSIGGMQAVAMKRAGERR